MTKFAVIKTGGKQYRVSEGDVIKVEKLGEKKAKAKITFDQVLLISDEQNKVNVGMPTVAGAKVEAVVTQPEIKARKVTGIKFKAKKRYRRTLGHRQRYMAVEIKKIVSQ